MYSGDSRFRHGMSRNVRVQRIESRDELFTNDKVPVYLFVRINLGCGESFDIYLLYLVVTLRSEVDDEVVTINVL